MQMTTTTTTEHPIISSASVNLLLITEPTFTLSEFSVTRIALFSLCLLVGFGILFSRLHARSIMFVGGLVIASMLTGNLSSRV